MKPTLAQAYRNARRILREAIGAQPHATPDLDARLLVAAACKCPAHAPLLDGGRQLAPAEARLISAYVARRCTGEPVARILGEKPFWGLDFHVDGHTLVPRPETEGIVEEVIAWAARSSRRAQALRIVDIGTGSGAILVALLTELPSALGIALDISFETLATARENAARHGVEARFFPVLSDYGTALGGAFDIVVSNPPYIGLAEAGALAADVRDFDPPRALFAGEDGLEAFRRIIPWCAEHLAVEGLAILEHGATQAEAVHALAWDAGFRRIECVFDMAKLPRFVKISGN